MTIKNKTTQNTFITYFVIIVAFVTIRALSNFGLLAFMGEAGEYVFNIVVQIGLLFCLSIFMFSGLQKQKVKTTFAFYGYKKITWKAVLITVVIGAIVYFLNIFVATFFDVLLSMLGYKFHAAAPVESYPIYMLFVNLIFTAVLPAVCEETAHRGMLLKGSTAFGQKYAIIISALLFGLMHMNIEQFFYATIIGLFMGYLSVICDSIYPAMIIHFMNNALGVYSGFSAFYKLPFAKAISAVGVFLSNNLILGLLFLILLVTLLSWLLFFLVKKLFKETTGKAMANLQVELYKEIAKKDYLSDIAQSKAELDGKSTMPEQTTINMEEMFIEKNINMGLMTNLDRELLKDSGHFKPNKISTVFIAACFFLTAVVTLFTFIWGVI